MGEFTKVEQGSREEQQEFFEKFFQEWIGPEVNRRVEDGSWNPRQSIKIAQLIISPSDEQQISLNREVQGEVIYALSPKMDPVPIVNDARFLKCICKYELPEHLMDWMHITIIWNGDKWWGFFNFAVNRKRAMELYARAWQYLEVARQSRDQGMDSPAVYNLFSACEMASKAELAVCQIDADSIKRHNVVSMKLTELAKANRVNPRLTKVLGQLSNARAKAAYGKDSELPPVPDEATFQVIEDVIVEGLFVCQRATERKVVSDLPPVTAAPPKADPR